MAYDNLSTKSIRTTIGRDAAGRERPVTKSWRGRKMYDGVCGRKTTRRTMV